jgi:predicted glycogen debranching enzyme
VRSLHFDRRPIDPALEWLVTNGLGGYASAPVAGGLTRRYHGVLIAALPSPHGRTVMVNHLRVALIRESQRVLIDHENLHALAGGGAAFLKEFRLENGLPVWQYDCDGLIVEQRLLMPHQQNTTHVIFRMIGDGRPATIEVEPMFHVRPHEEALSDSPAEPGRLTMSSQGVEIELAPGVPPLRIGAPQGAEFVFGRPTQHRVEYIEERARGYADAGELWTPGVIAVPLAPERRVALVFSTEPWQTLQALTFDAVLQTELDRRARLLDRAQPAAKIGVGAELTLAADQFIIVPAGRRQEAVVARAAGDEPRTVIAGYHWFTDWGRDTMISLEGLTLITGRVDEAGYILRTFGHHVKDGLIPNMFPEGENSGLYHTADATLWFFHAVDRYLALSQDRATLHHLLPTFVDIAEHHLAGTRFGIRVDPDDALLTQGAEGYQLTWMDAKVDDWVVTPRRGKAVEINALWYSALCLLSGWLRHEGDPAASDKYKLLADRCQASFNRRFWNPSTNHLFDVVDGERGDDPACRPNQLLAISLPHPVLAPDKWEPVCAAVRERLLTPVGLRSLAPGHPDYRAKYYGDLRARDAAYHQGTVWGWLIGPYVDAYLKLRPDDVAGAREALHGFVPHLDEACVGSISEIFDADAPFTPRGCIAQAWSVAELLRCWAKTAHT